MKLVTTRSNGRLFDERPIKLDGFELRHHAVFPVGKPTIKQWQAAFDLASAASESSPYWVGDLVAYADNRADWREKIDQAKAVTGLAEQTLHNLASIARRVAPEERELSPSLAHSEIVARMPKAEQRRWLKKATMEGWNRREFRMEVQASQKRGVLSGAAELSGMFRVWSIDFPWKYNQAQPSTVSAQSRFPGMTIAEGIKMGDQIKAHCTRNAVAFFWVTAPMLYYATKPDLGPDPYRLIRAWGFTPKTGGVWDKVEHNFGHYLSIRHEHLIIATRGSCLPDRPTPMLDSIFVERKSDIHSEKPKAARQYIERLYDGPRVELFAREQHEDWTCWGNQVGELLVKRAQKAG